MQIPLWGLYLSGCFNIELIPISILDNRFSSFSSVFERCNYYVNSNLTQAVHLIRTNDRISARPPVIKLHECRKARRCPRLLKPSVCNELTAAQRLSQTPASPGAKSGARNQRSFLRSVCKLLFADYFSQIKNSLLSVQLIASINISLLKSGSS